MTPLSNRIRTTHVPDMQAIADAVDVLASQVDHWQRICVRLLPHIPRESLSVAERVMLDVALEKLRAGDGAAGVSAPDIAAVRCPSSARSGVSP